MYNQKVLKSSGRPGQFGSIPPSPPFLEFLNRSDMLHTGSRLSVPKIPSAARGAREGGDRREDHGHFARLEGPAGGQGTRIGIG